MKNPNSIFLIAESFVRFVIVSLVGLSFPNFWLATHVTAITIGYAAGVLAASGVALVLLSPRSAPQKSSLRRLEREVVRMSASMLYGGPDVVGTITAGGTESILMAVKAYRDRARSKRGRRLRRPNMVLPQSAHVAFEKGAHYFDLETRFAPMGDDFADKTANMIANLERGLLAPIEMISRLAA